MKINDFLSLHKSEDYVSCVYFLKNDGEIVYIGSTDNPHKRAYSHKLSDKVFDDVSIMTCHKHMKLEVEADLIRKHLPMYNILVPKKADPNKQQIKTVQLHPLTADKLKAIALKRKQGGKNSNKQTEILTELVNKLFDKECK